MSEQLRTAERLNMVAQHVGFALWQLQQLETSAATFLVLLTQVQRGMGETAGNTLLKAAQAKTFGATIQRMEKAGLLNPDLSAEFARLLTERNWLVHRSRTDGRGAVYVDEVLEKLLQRLDTLADDATVLLKKISTMTEGFAIDHGMPKVFIDRQAQQMLKQWEQGDS
jgi:hypothetical protein